MIREVFDAKFVKFLIIGAVNTAFSAIIMFIMYNSMGLGYWGSSFISYILASILSFFLNRNITFKNSEPILKTAIKFSINVAVCYFFAYLLARPVISILLSGMMLSPELIDKSSMLLGMVLFTLLNYMGQRFFAFK